MFWIVSIPTAKTLGISTMAHSRDSAMTGRSANKGDKIGEMLEGLKVGTGMGSKGKVVHVTKD